MTDRNSNISSLKNMVKNQINGIHTSLPGTIVSYDASTCRASIRPSLIIHKTDGENVNYPVIVNCPVWFPKGGGASITYPVSAGDPCVIMFMEKSLDEWKGSSEVDPRRFDLTDAVVFVGMQPADSADGSNVVISNNGTTLSVAPGGDVTISGGDLIVGGISFLKHVHGGVLSGGSKTAVPE